MTIIIGLTGYAQHGKDTVGQVAVEGFGFRRMAFADPLKSMALVLNPIIAFAEDICDDVVPRRLAEIVDGVGWETAKTSPEVRRFLQVLGTEGVRGHLGNDAWVNALANSIEPTDERVVITDCRFPNEFAFVRKVGVLVRVTRLNEDGSPFDNGLGTEHPSEQYIADAPADLDIVCKSGVPVLQSIGAGVIESVVRDRES